MGIIYISHTFKIAAMSKSGAAADTGEHSSENSEVTLIPQFF